MNTSKMPSCQIKKNVDMILLEFEESFPDESMVALCHTLGRIFSKKKFSKILIDLKKNSHPNFFGLGFFLGFLKLYAQNGCEIQIFNGSPEILKTLQSFCFPSSWISDQSEILNEPFSPWVELDHFVLIPETQDVISGRAFNLRIEARDLNDHLVENYLGVIHLMSNRGLISPTLIPKIQKGVWNGRVILSGSGIVKLRVWDEQVEGSSQLKVRDEMEPAVTFPIRISCPICQKNNFINRSDIFHCLQCKLIYFVDPHGHIIPLKPGNHQNSGFIRHLAFTIPSDINYLNYVRNFIVGISKEKDMDEEKISQIEMALDEALANVIEHAYAYDCYQNIEIQVDWHSHKMVILIRDFGRVFDNEHAPLPNLREHIEQRRVGGLGRYLIKTLMDEIEYRRLQNANELRMVKYLEPRSDS